MSCKRIANCRKGTSQKNSQYHFSPFWYSSVTEEYQDGENSYCEFFGLVPFLQLAIQMATGRVSSLFNDEVS
jgi:hypothetical protein